MAIKESKEEQTFHNRQSYTKQIVNLILSQRNKIYYSTIAFIMIFHVLEFTMPTPIKRLPDLWLVLNNTFCLVWILFLFVYGHLLMLLACDTHTFVESKEKEDWINIISIQASHTLK